MCAQRSFSLPRLGRRALGVIGAAYDEMRDALAGRNDVADCVQTLTHEVKGPQSSIRGAAELLQKPMPDADRARFTADSLRETERIQQFVDRMMALTALESRKSLEITEPMALRPLLLELAASARSAAAPRGQRVIVSGDERGGAIVVEGDAFLLQRVVAKLIDNALDFSPSSATVTLGLVRRGRSVDVTVRDTRPGFPDYAEDKVFEKFYSLARPHWKKRARGSGFHSSRRLPSSTTAALPWRMHPTAALSLPCRSRRLRAGLSAERGAATPTSMVLEAPDDPRFLVRCKKVAIERALALCHVTLTAETRNLTRGMFEIQTHQDRRRIHLRIETFFRGTFEAQHALIEEHVAWIHLDEDVGAAVKIEHVHAGDVEDRTQHSVRTH